MSAFILIEAEAIGDAKHEKGQIKLLFMKKPTAAMTVSRVALLALALLVVGAQCAVFTVNSTAVDGTPGSFRWAISAANGNYGADEVCVCVGLLFCFAKIYL